MATLTPFNDTLASKITKIASSIKP